MNKARYLVTMGLAASLLVLAFTVAPGGAAVKKKPKPPAVTTLNVVFPTSGADTLNYVGIAAGFFKKNYLKVNMVIGTAATLASAVVSGQAQLAVDSTAVPLQIAIQGEPTTVIYSNTGGGEGGSLVANAGTTIASLEAESKPGCLIGTLTQGTSAYGDALIYIKDLKLPCTAEAFTTTAAEVGALAGGSVEAVAGNISVFATSLAAGQVVALANSETPSVSQQYLGTYIPEVITFGLTATVRDLKPAIIRYITALNEAAKWLANTPTDTAAQEIASQPLLAGETLTQIELVVSSLQAYRWRGSTKGYITQQEWGRSMNAVATWGVSGFTSGAPYTKYATAVNMSYYDAALGKPKS